MTDPSTTTGLTLHGVSAAPGGNPVLHDIDLEVPPGSSTTVLGPSGTGKTTLLRVVAGLEPVSAGSVRVGGRDITSVPAHQRRVGVVFQEPRLFPHRSVRDNVAFGLEVAGVDRDARRARADALLERVGLGGLGGRTVEGLSGGEQQRVNLARALAVEPEVLLLDEPLSSVDPERRDALRTVIAEVTAELTSLHVTHDRAEAAELGDHVAVLLDGRLAQHAPPRELFEQPASVDVARLLGAALLAGQVRDGHLRLPAGTVPVDGPDGPATIAVRPEHVRLGAGPLHATVRSATYRGATVRVVLDLGHDVEIAADTATDTLPTVGSTTRLDLDRVWRIPTTDPLPSPTIPERTDAS